MISLFDYEVLVNETFYRCWHILEYIEKHPDMSELDRQAIKATIMDALVTRKLINPDTQSLNLDNLCIVNNLEGYNYEKYPNISGIPLWMKEEFRKKSLCITGGIPISMFLAKPPSKLTRYCVYDPNIAVSSIFKDATFYNVIYNSPTRGVKIESSRPFVEVKIDDELYLVDTLTKNILKSDWFRDTYGFEIKNQHTISKMSRKEIKYYKESISEHKNLVTALSFMMMLLELNRPEYAEMKFEIEQSKIYCSDEWQEYEFLMEERKNYDMSFLNSLKKNN